MPNVEKAYGGQATSGGYASAESIPVEREFQSRLYELQNTFDRMRNVSMRLSDLEYRLMGPVPVACEKPESTDDNDYLHRLDMLLMQMRFVLQQSETSLERLERF